MFHPIKKMPSVKESFILEETRWVLTDSLPKENFWRRGCHKIMQWALSYFAKEEHIMGKAWRREGKIRLKLYLEEGISTSPHFLHCFTRSVELEPNNYKNYFYQARAFYALKQFRSALNAFDKALGFLEPTSLSYECKSNTKSFFKACLGACYENCQEYLLAYQFYDEAQMKKVHLFYQQAKDRLYQKVVALESKNVSNCKLLVHHRPSCPYHHIELGMAYLKENYPKAYFIHSLKEAGRVAHQDNQALGLIQGMMEALASRSVSYFMASTLESPRMFRSSPST